MKPAESNMSTESNNNSADNMVNFEDVAAWLKAYINIYADTDSYILKSMIRSMYFDLVKQKMTKEQFEE